MDFARKQLEKYGWSDGKGLGKNENGISEAIKPKLKRSMAGVGHDAAADFTEHWWSTLYDKAANNIEVKEKDGDIKNIVAKDVSGFEITNSTWKLKKKKSSDPKSQDQYKDFFVKTVVLGSGGSKLQRVKESDSEEDDVKEDVIKLTDEELFAACGGRTAHKGARHGLNALGKLARIEQQEQLLLQQEKFKGYSHANKYITYRPKEQNVFENINLNSDEVPKIAKKKKKKKRHCLMEKNEGIKEDTNKNFNDTLTAKRKKKELHKKLESDTIVSNRDLNSDSIKKSEAEVDIEIENSTTDSVKLKRRRKHKNGVTNEDSFIQSEVLGNEITVTHKKRKKKKVT